MCAKSRGDREVRDRVAGHMGNVRRNIENCQRLLPEGADPKTVESLQSLMWDSQNLEKKVDLMAGVVDVGVVDKASRAEMATSRLYEAFMEGEGEEAPALVEKIRKHVVDLRNELDQM